MLIVSVVFPLDLVIVDRRRLKIIAPLVSLHEASNGSLYIDQYFVSAVGECFGKWEG